MSKKLRDTTDTHKTMTPFNIASTKYGKGSKQSI